MASVAFSAGDVVYRPGGPIRHVYFPYRGAFSLLAAMPDGRAVEAGSVGSDGVLGLSAFHGAVRSRAEVVCQFSPSAAWRMAGDAFQREAGRPGPLRDLLHSYTRVLFDRVSLAVACGVLHPAPQRCATWLLLAWDRAEAAEFDVTHEHMARLLGMRRATVTDAAGKLQASGAIAYRHGRVCVLNRTRLEAAACECYRGAQVDFDGPTLTRPNGG